jgi:hypothetical protein
LIAVGLSEVFIVGHLLLGGAGFRRPVRLG